MTGKTAYVAGTRYEVPISRIAKQFGYEEGEYRMPTQEEQDRARAAGQGALLFVSLVDKPPRVAQMGELKTYPYPAHISGETED